MKVDIPHSKSTIWKCTAQMADKVQYSQHECTRLLSGGRVCLVSYFMSTCSIIASLLTSECSKALTIWQEIPLVEIVTSQAAPTSHFYHPKALWCIQSLRGEEGCAGRWIFLEKTHLAEKLKTQRVGGGGHMFVWGTGVKLKLTISYFICIIQAISSGPTGCFQVVELSMLKSF